MSVAKIQHYFRGFRGSSVVYLHIKYESATSEAGELYPQSSSVSKSIPAFSLKASIIISLFALPLPVANFLIDDGAISWNGMSDL